MPRLDLSPFTLALLFAVLASCGSEGAGPEVTDAGMSADAGACPRVTCTDLDLSGASSATRYDASTHVLRLVLGASAPSVVSGSVSFMSAPAATAPSVHSAPLVVQGREASADLSAWLNASTAYVGALSITLVTSCGATSVIGNLDLITRSGDSGLEIMSFVCR